MLTFSFRKFSCAISGQKLVYTLYSGRPSILVRLFGISTLSTTIDADDATAVNRLHSESLVEG